MEPKPTVEQLCSEYRNDDFHSGHVAVLAVRIFDRVHGFLKVHRRDRRIVETAALLHDVGYSVCPEDHAAAAADAILRRGISGFRPSSIRCISEIVCLHRRNCAGTEDYAVLRDAYSLRVLRLASIVRVADGLDHGHIQNTAILSIGMRTNAFVIRVQSSGYGGNIECALRKSDLWRHVFSIGLEVRTERPDARESKSDDVLHGEESALSAVRLLLCNQHRAALDNCAGTVVAESPEPLHDLRVALRRFRAVLRLFRKNLEGASAAELDDSLSELGTKLGPARDADVWLAFLGGGKAEERCAADSCWQAYVADQAAERDRQVARLRRILRGKPFVRTKSALLLFLRVELPDLARRRPVEHAAPVGARKLRKLLHRISAWEQVTDSSAPAEIHQLRKVCRRGRYWAEFFRPVLGPVCVTLAKDLKKLADVLGDLHDSDVWLAKCVDGDVSAPASLICLIRERRGAAWQDFRKKWQKVRGPEYVKRMRKKLKQAAARKVARTALNDLS